MKKSELKNIIKECVREVIFEEGTLSNIVSEVVQGLGTASLVTEAPRRAPAQPNAAIAAQLEETKRQMLGAVASDSYESAKKQFKNPELFEGTRPLPADKSGKGGALQGVDPRDPGLDISQIPGFGSWGNIANNI
jgi:hypothetical protein